MTDTVYDAMLTLAIPAALEADVLDFLLLHPELAPGFSLADAQGMGQGASLRTPMEQVLGRCRRKLIYIVGSVERLGRLTTAMGGQLRNPEIVYWVTPVLQFGRLA